MKLFDTNYQEMSNQYNPQGYSTSYPNYNYGNNQYYMGYGQPQTSYVPGSVQPVPPGEDYPQTSWSYVDPNKHDAVQQNVTVNSTTTNSKPTKDENKGVLEERKQQKMELIKQRDEYERRVTVLRRELEMLRKQKQELISEGALERDHILRENGKLQVEIQNKLKDANNVIEILSGIIGDTGKSSKEESPKDSHRRSSDKGNGDKYNYIHYDPEVHWCRICDVFPRTAKDFLMHLHSKEHKKLMQEENLDNPWHKLPKDPEFPFYEGVPKKRLPIKGLQFIISSTAWYCRLCDTWIGDLHCASHHLKSLTHSQNYTNFVEQNPHWEIEWLKDREKALERTRQNRSSESEDEENKKKKKRKKSPLNMSNRDKKKKKRSKKRKKQSSDTSSSSSSTDTSSDDDKNDKSKSIRVAMRNKIKAQLLNDDDKWEVLGRLVEERKRKEATQIPDIPKKPEEDNLISQWMCVKEPQDKDKVMLDNLKDRMKKKQDAEKAKFLEMEQQRKEKEKLEREQKEREEEEARQREEQKRREQEEAMRLKEKDREQVRFKTRDKYRRRRSSSHSPDHRRSRSPSNDRRRSRYSSERRRKYSENGRRSRSRSATPDNRYRRKDDSDKKDRKSSSSKKLPFIGRMPLFKNKKPEDKAEKEIKKEDYEPQRVTRFQPGNLARAFIPQPDVVCFPKLSTYPPICAPPPPAPVITEPPAPPKIGIPPKAPPPPKINKESPQKEAKNKEHDKVEDINMVQDSNAIYEQMDPNDVYQFEYNMYQTPPYDYTKDDIAAGAENPITQHSMPLQPPPLPPDDPSDDLALLGISSDDLAAQLF